MKLSGMGTVKYHLTRPHNRFRIACNGLKTDLDARKKGRIWLCDLTEIGSVADHLTERDGSSYAIWALLAINTAPFFDDVKRCGRSGIYYVEKNIPAHLITIHSQVVSDLLQLKLDEAFAC